MRVISGSARGVNLETLEGLETRPTTDRVKESIFNLINFEITGADVLDLFSGSGALGIEAGSRGANSITLVEQNRKCVEIINNNLTKTKLKDLATVINSDWSVSLDRLKGESFDIVIMDPPYLKDFIVPVIKRLSENNLVSEDGLILVEHEKTDKLPETIEDFKMAKQKKYGKTLVSIFRRNL